MLTLSLLAVMTTGSLMAEDKPAKSDNSGCGTTQTVTQASPNDEQPASKTMQKQKKEKPKKG